MKKLILVLLCLPMIGFGQCTFTSINESFPGACDGAAAITPVGCTVFTVHWSDGQATLVASALCAGTYSFDIIDVISGDTCCSNTVIILSPVAIQEHTANKELLKVTDLLGRETKGTKNEVLFYIYDDGTVEKRIVIE